MSKNPAPEIRAALVNLYDVFRKYHPQYQSKLHPRERAEYDVGFSGIPEDMFAYETEQIPIDLLHRVFWHALTTCGSDEAFKWWLPRIIEVVLTTDTIGFDHYILGAKLEYGEFWTWPSIERTAVSRVFRVYWKLLLNAEIRTNDIADVLEMLVRIREPMGEYLTRWDLDIPNSVASAIYFYSFVTDHVLSDLPRGRPWQSWSCQESTDKELNDWIYCEEKLTLIRDLPVRQIRKHQELFNIGSFDSFSHRAYVRSFENALAARSCR